MQLQYDQKLPPPQSLKRQTFQNGYQLSLLTVKKLPSQVLTLKYSPDDKYIGIGCRSGTRILFSAEERTHSRQFADKIVDRFDCLNETSVTCLRWRPSNQGKYSVLATTDADGFLNYWHVPSMKKIFNLKEDNNSIMCLDFHPQGLSLATAGKDACIRIYDEQTKSINLKCEPASWNNAGHENRIFCIKYIDDNTLISGGWDSVVHIWDLREGKSIRHFKGPHISGDSLDYQNGKILAGCYSAQNQVQVWNFVSGQKIEEIDWTGDIDQAEYVYTAGYSKHNLGIFGAGSTGPNAEVRLFQEGKGSGKLRKINSISGLSQGCFSMDFAHKHQQFAFSTAHHGLYIYNYKKKSGQK